MVCAPDSVIFAVVAATQDAFGSNPCATASTYCLVASCRAEVGSWVTATDVRPPRVRLVAPRLMAVVPTVNELLVRLELAMLLRVLLEPLMVLLVSVSVVSRATKVSVAVGSVNVPVLTMVAITGAVSVLLVSVWVPVRVTTVLSMEIVPVEVIGPPVRPVPVAMDVTPEPDARLVHAPLMYPSNSAIVLL